ncbi:MAG: S1C family serine protease [Bacteroidota bacterium]
MYKKITSLLLAVLMITVATQGFFLYQTFRKTQTQNTKHAKNAHALQSISKQLEKLENNVDKVQKQLTQEEVKLSTETISLGVQENAHKASVKINVTAPVTPYQNYTNWFGSGVVFNKKKGYVFTNSHVVNLLIAGKCEVQFFEGTITYAKVIYVDPWLDITVVQVNPTEIPQQATEAKLSEKAPKVNDAIFIVNNSEGNSNAIHTGRINNLEEITMATGSYQNLPQGDITYSSNTIGGSSGSAVYDTEGKIVSLNHAMSRTYGLGCDLTYLRYIKDAVEKGKQPVRKHMGAILSLLPLADANLSKKEIAALKKQLPANTKYLMRVNGMIKGTPAEKILKPGDIIYAAQGKTLGGNLATLDILMSKAPQSHITLDIYRQGKMTQVKVPLYDMHKHAIKKLVYFGGAYWFEADDCWAYNVAMKPRSVTFYKIEQGKSFSTSKYFRPRRFHSTVTHLNGKPIKSLDELIGLIPTLIKKGKLNIEFLKLTQQPDSSDIEYNPNDPAPTVFTYNPKTLAWDIEKIKL